MWQLAERACFVLCRASGRMLRSARYTNVRIVPQGGALQVRKSRRPYAPLLVRLGNLLMRALDTGVQVLPQRAWAERERAMYRRLHGRSMEIADDGALVLPALAGETLAALLEHPGLAQAARTRAIALAARALADLHRLEVTHADAMAENVLVDLGADSAHWFDFETVHHPARAVAWRRADDLRALLMTCLLRTPPTDRAATLRLVLDAYGDEDVIGALAAHFTSASRPYLIFHLGQAALSFHAFREMAGLLRHRSARTLPEASRPTTPVR